VSYLIKKYKITRPKTTVRERRINYQPRRRHIHYTLMHAEKEPATGNSILPMQKRLKRFSRYSATTAAAYTMHDGQSSQKVGRRGREKICKYLITTTTMCKRRTTENVFYTSSPPRGAAFFDLFLY